MSDEFSCINSIMFTGLLNEVDIIQQSYVGGCSHLAAA